MTDPKAPRRDCLTRFQVQGRRKSAKTYGVRPWLADAAVLEGMPAGERSDFLREAIATAILAKQKTPTKTAGVDAQGEVSS